MQSCTISKFNVELDGCSAHCQQLEGEYWENDGLIAEHVGEVIVSLDGDSDTYSSDEDTRRRS